VGISAGLVVREKREISFPCRESTHNFSVVQAIPTELSRLLTYSTTECKIMINSLHRALNTNLEKQEAEGPEGALVFLKKFCVRVLIHKGPSENIIGYQTTIEMQ
jgi:hypothetical protein